MMFGFACRETTEYMPLPITLAHNLCSKLSEVRKSGMLSYLRPDGKSQVTVEYDNGLPTRIDTVVIAAQHDENIDLIQLRQDIKKHIIVPVCGDLLDENTKFHINETGRFVI
jgi:S-adenosylmethionine synthetase